MITTTLRRHWRITAVAALGAVLAFLCSFLVAPTYQSSTRLLIHGRDAGLLSSSGQDAANQNPLTDAAQASALAETYGNIATSRALAESVVEELSLDADDGGGLLSAVAGVGAWTYRCVRAFVTAGFCASVDRREAAIAGVQEGTTAAQLGATVGASAGQPGSYVLEITGSGESGAEAQAVTNAVADQLVRASGDLVRDSAEDYIERLTAQLEQARQDVNARAAAVTDFERANNVSAADQETVVAATSYDNLRAELNTARADLADAEARLQSINASLAATPSTTNSDQQIDTGRSGTSITTNQTNPVYSDLLGQRSETDAAISGLQARVAVLEQQVASGSPTALSGTLADLADLQAELTAAQDSRDQLSTALAQANAQAATATPDLTRIDEAGRPAYPVSPKRYLYLLLGLLLGGLAGWGLTWLGRRRSPEPDGAVDDPRDDDVADAEDSTLADGLLGRTPAADDREPVPALNGHGRSDTLTAGLPSEGPRA